MEVKNQLQKISGNLGSNLDSIKYFYNRLADYYNTENQNLSKRKVIATTCLYVPDELIYAVDAIPLRICNGSFSLDQIGAE